MITGLCQGCFDVLHAGHIRHLRAAKARVDRLVVAVTVDEHVNKGPGRPINTLKDRMAVLEALEMIDEVIISYSESAVDVIKRVQPDLYIKGAEYRDKPDPSGRIDLEREAVVALGGNLIFTDEKTDSSTRIINSTKLEAQLESIRGLKVALYGDWIMDGTGGKVMKPGHMMLDLGEVVYDWGGVMAFSRHAMGLGCRTRVETSLPVIKKIRLPDGSRIDILPDVLEERIEQYGEAFTDPQLTIVADFGHTTSPISASSWPLILRSKFIAWNAQANTANQRDLHSYWLNQGLEPSLITMNEREWISCKGYIPQAKHVVVTKKSGATLIGGYSIEFDTDLPVVDTTGCGDAFCTAIACAMAVGVDVYEAMKFGCLAGLATTQWALNKEAICPQRLIETTKHIKFK